MGVRNDWFTRAVTWVVLVGMVCGPAIGRDVKLAIHPQKVSADSGKYALLPPQVALTDGDAIPVYEKAIKALPPDTDLGRIHDWLELPIAKLPLQEVQRVLEDHKESLKEVAKAARCRECKWPKVTPGQAMANLPQFRMLGFVVRLQTRCAIAQKDYDEALLTLRTGFAMGRHLTQAPTLVQFLVGVSVASIMCAEIEAFAQADDAPNLHAALAALPKPFADVERAISVENKSVPSEPPVEGVARELFKMAAKSRAQTYDRIRAGSKRLDRDLAASQCIEGIRSYSALHGGQLPQTLADITEVSVPRDPVTGEAFRYTRTGATAVLESPAPAGDEKGGLRYEIAVKN